MSDEAKLEKIKDNIQEEIDLMDVEAMIQNNVTQFTFKDGLYRIRPLQYAEKQKAYKLKVDTYTKLLRDENNLLEEDLKKLYLRRGIDIEAMSSEIMNLEFKKKRLEEGLGKLLKEKKGETQLETLKEEITSLKHRQLEISIKKTNLLQSSIESQVTVELYQYITFLVTEKQTEGKDLGEGVKDPDTWAPAWATYDDYLKSPDGLVNRASFTVSLMIGQI